MLKNALVSTRIWIWTQLLRSWPTGTRVSVVRVPVLSKRQCVSWHGGWEVHAALRHKFGYVLLCLIVWIWFMICLDIERYFLRWKNMETCVVPLHKATSPEKWDAATSMVPWSHGPMHSVPCPPTARGRVLCRRPLLVRVPSRPKYDKGYAAMRNAMHAIMQLRWKHLSHFILENRLRTPDPRQQKH